MNFTRCTPFFYFCTTEVFYKVNWYSRDSVEKNKSNWFRLWRWLSDEGIVSMTYELCDLASICSDIIFKLFSALIVLAPKLRFRFNFLFFQMFHQNPHQVIIFLPHFFSHFVHKTNEILTFPMITVFLLIRAPSLIVAPPPEKPLNHDNIMNYCLLK